MRRTAPMRWNEEAEARKIRLLAAETMPASAANGGAAELPIGKTSVTVLLARMTGRVVRLTRARPSRSRGEPPTEGPDCGSRWRAVAAAAISEWRLVDRRAA
jgi:hypothetical protein